MKMEEYLNSLTKQIRCQRAREPVRREIQAHIEDQTEAFQMDGMSEEEAREAAVLDMGDPVAVGNDMDRLHRPKMPWSMLVFSGLLGTAGLLVQYLVQLFFTELPWTADISFGRQFFYLVISILVMTAVCRFDYSRIGYYAKEIYLGLFALLLLGMVAGAVPVNGAARWISLPFPGIQLNVSMLVLLFVPLYGAILYLHRGQGYRGLSMAAIRWMLPALLLAWLCSSIYTIFLLLLAFLVVFTAAVCQNWFCVSKRRVLLTVYSAVLLLAGILIWCGLNYGAGYQAARIQSYLTRGHSNSYQAEVLRQIIASSRWTGPVKDNMQDLMAALSSLDYTLAYVIACCGRLAGILAVSLILILILLFFRLARKQKNQMGMMMGIGGSTVFLFQLIFYVTDNLGVSLMGSYCPFLSYGGSGMLVTYILCGLMLSICCYEDTFPEADIHCEAEERKGVKRSVVFSYMGLLILVSALAEMIGK